MIAHQEIAAGADEGFQAALLMSLYHQDGGRALFRSIVPQRPFTTFRRKRRDVERFSQMTRTPVLKIEGKCSCLRAKPAHIPPGHLPPGPKKHRYGIPPEEWQSIRRRVLENREPLRQVAGDYGVSYETVRRVILVTHKQAN
jgi:hypothetical protein